MFKKLVSMILSLAMVLSLVAVSASATGGQYTYLESDAWTDQVKDNINAMFDQYGKYSDGYDENCKPYAVFDFDNTTSVMDVGQQIFIHSLMTLRFGMDSSERLMEMLLSEIPDPDKVVDGHSLREYATDIANAYDKLLAKGYVDPDPHDIPTTMEEDPDWMEFATKARLMYGKLSSAYTTYVVYPWISYWFTDMTPEQVTALALESHQKWMGLTGEVELKLYKNTWTSPADYESLTGQQSITFNMGIHITPELKELYQAMEDNGFDVWINSASYVDVIKAIPDHPEIFGVVGVDGVVAMTNVIKDDGTYDCKYDYYLHPQTQGHGKSETIDKLVAPNYGGNGPVFVASDSSGDFNFVTEYKDTALCLILNRNSSDDFGLLCASAVYQEKNGIDLAKAQEMGDTLYVMQGRDETVPALWKNNATLSVGKEPGQEALLSANGQKWLEMLEDGTYDSIGALINDCVNINHKLGFYVGYKTRDNVEWVNPFTDVTADDWFYDAVASVNADGLMVGTSDDQFAPKATVTRAALITTLYRMAGDPVVAAASPFVDVDEDAWYGDAVIWAVSNGIANGVGNDKFAPNATLTREQVATFLYRFARAEAGAADLSTFADADQISTYAQDAMTWAVAEGLLNGVKADTLAPQGNMTRAQMATILDRFG